MGHQKYQRNKKKQQWNTGGSLRCATTKNLKNKIDERHQTVMQIKLRNKIVIPVLRDRDHNRIRLEIW